MSGILVLSDILKGGNKLEKTLTSKGKGVSDGPANAAAQFATMLSGSMNLNIDPKGQNSKAGQDSEEKQSAQDPVPSAKLSNGQESMIEYGNFALPNLFHPMLQSGLPAGKEANSGNDVSQGTAGLATAKTSLTSVPVVAGNDVELALLNLVSLGSDEESAQSGMTTPKPQGETPEITELDKYRQVIGDLLQKLSGEIKDISPKVNSLSMKNFGLNGSCQGIAKVITGRALIDDVVKDSFAPSVEAPSVQTTGRGETAKEPIATLSTKDNPVSVESIGTKESPTDTVTKVGQGQTPLTNEVTRNASSSNVKAVKGEVVPLSVEVAKTSQEGSATTANLSTSTQVLVEHPETFIPKVEKTGEVKSSSLRENPISLENVVKKDLSQDKSFVVPGQRMKTDEVSKGSYAPRVEAPNSQTTGRVVAAKDLSFTSSPNDNPISVENIGTKESPTDTVTKVGQGHTPLTNEVTKNAYGYGSSSNVQAANGEVPLSVEAAKTSQEGSATKADLTSSPQVLVDHPETFISKAGDKGEVKASSPRVKSLGSESTVKKEFSQDKLLVVPGQGMKTDDVVKGSYAPSVEATNSQTTGKVENAKDLSFTSSPNDNPISVENIGTKESPTDTVTKVGQAQIPLTNEVARNASSSSSSSNVQAANGEAATLSVEAVKTSLEGSATKAGSTSTPQVLVDPTKVIISKGGESGEEKSSSPRENPISLENAVKKELSQDKPFVVPGQEMKADDVVKSSYVPRAEAPSSQSTGGVETAKVPIATSSPNDNPISVESIGTKESPTDTATKVGQAQMPLTNEVAKNVYGSGFNVQAVNGEAATLSGGVAQTSQEGSATTANLSTSTQVLVEHPETFIPKVEKTGEVKSSSLRENPISLENVVKKDLSQDKSFVVPGQRIKTDDVVKGSYAPRVEAPNSQTTGRVVAAKEPGFTASPKDNPISVENIGTKEPRQDTKRVGQGQTPLTNEVAKNAYGYGSSSNVQATNGEATLSAVAAQTSQEGSATTVNLSTSTQVLVEHPETFISKGRESGEDKSSSPRENPISVESIGTKQSRQDTATRVGQAQMSLTNEVVKNAYGFGSTSSEEAIIKKANLSSSQALNRSEVLNELGSESVGMKDTSQVMAKIIQSGKPLMGMEADLFLRKFQRAFSKEIPEVESAKPEIMGVKDPQTKNTDTAIGFAGNIVSVNSPETKTAAIPVWQQISNVFREQVMNTHQEIKELDIQLHPADLGKIQIVLRWENGQVHLQVQASEASTGKILQNQLSELRQTLSNQGVNCGMLQMGQGGGERQQNSRGYEQSRHLSPNAQTSEDENPIKISNPFFFAQDEINLINVTA